MNKIEFKAILIINRYKQDFIRYFMQKKIHT